MSSTCNRLHASLPRTASKFGTSRAIGVRGRRPTRGALSISRAAVADGRGGGCRRDQGRWKGASCAVMNPSRGAAKLRCDATTAAAEVLARELARATSYCGGFSMPTLATVELAENLGLEEAPARGAARRTLMDAASRCAARARVEEHADHASVRVRAESQEMNDADRLFVKIDTNEQTASRFAAARRRLAARRREAAAPRRARDAPPACLRRSLGSEGISRSCVGPSPSLREHAHLWGGGGGVRGGTLDPSRRRSVCGRHDRRVIAPPRRRSAARRRPMSPWPPSTLRARRKLVRPPGVRHRLARASASSEADGGRARACRRRGRRARARASRPSRRRI